MIEKAKRHIKEILVEIKFKIWEKDRKKHLIFRAGEFPTKKILFPYESDFLSLINEYCITNSSNLKIVKKYKKIGLYVFKIHLKKGADILAFPIELKKHELILKQEQRESDGFHSVVDKEEKVQLYDIEKINVICDCDDFVVQNISEPMYGYKAISEENGRLLAKGHEYRLNKPYIVDVRNPYTTDFGDCYLHFCTTMEYVVLCPGGTNYLESIKNYKKENMIITRLFQVKAEGHCVRHQNDWWVTNNLTVIREVTKEEIHSYFMNNLPVKEKLTERLGLSQDFWEKFLKSQIPPFIELETTLK